MLYVLQHNKLIKSDVLTLLVMSLQAVEPINAMVAKMVMPVLKRSKALDAWQVSMHTLQQ